MEEIIKLLENINKYGTLDATDHEVIAEIIDDLKNSEAPVFPNGFTNWVETHHNVVVEIERMIDTGNDTLWPKKLADVQANGGQGGVWELCEQITHAFERKNRGRDLVGEYFEELHDFINAYLNEESEQEVTEELDRKKVMYNFLEEDFGKLERAIERQDMESISKFFSYWNMHLKSLKP
jgi:hypothetical protein